MSGDHREAMLGASGRPGRVRGPGPVVISCVFHEERTPSLYLYHDHYQCFGCQEHGSAADFLRRMKYSGHQEKEGYRMAYHDLGEDGAERSLPRTNMARWREEARREREVPVLSDLQREALQSAVVLYTTCLNKGTPVTAKLYAEQRGLMGPDGYARDMVGYCSGEGLLRRLQTGGLIDAATQIGLLGLGRDGLHRERFAGRLILPDCDAGNRSRWMTGRAVPGLIPDKIAQQRKYLHLSAPRVLFGAAYWEKSEEVLIVEGPLCQLALRRLGIPAVALCGLSLPQGGLSYFKDKTVIPCFDAPRTRDEARDLYLAYERLADDLEHVAREIADPIDLSDTGAHDPAEYIQKYGCFPL